mmetsp:Transcript_48502/g.140499  ORF Transcript_48502/g.140499 Transcript_48502/m.140499 type:complete len:275 (-) Transcript_48502:8-832(-)
MHPTVTQADLRPDVVSPVKHKAAVVAQRSSDEREAVCPLTTPAMPGLQQPSRVIVPREARHLEAGGAPPGLHACRPEAELLVVGRRHASTLSCRRAAARAERPVRPAEKVSLEPSQQVTKQFTGAGPGSPWTRCQPGWQGSYRSPPLLRVSISSCLCSIAFQPLDHLFRPCVLESDRAEGTTGATVVITRVATEDSVIRSEPPTANITYETRGWGEARCQCVSCVTLKDAPIPDSSTITLHWIAQLICLRHADYNNERATPFGLGTANKARKPK